MHSKSILIYGSVNCYYVLIYDAFVGNTNSCLAIKMCEYVNVYILKRWRNLIIGFTLGVEHILFTLSITVLNLLHISGECDSAGLNIITYSLI